MSSTLDPREAAKFAAMAQNWWDPHGPMAPLHKLNPTRLAYLRQEILIHFDRADAGRRPLEGLSIVDIGCGGGLVSEPMARLGANVTGLDGAAETIESARVHAHASRLAIDYRVGVAEDLAASGALFDVVLALEIVEHVADVGAFLRAAGALARPGGLLIVSTINRTPQALAVAIVGAEHVLRWLPVGTHDHAKFVRPDELKAVLPTFSWVGPTSLSFNPVSRQWRMGGDASVNYFMCGAKPPKDH
jgi:2-polyprenyl-6-hydroxyphenyl methylase/3-demethylubiquinone-9 3-methyltransferase